MVLITDSVTTLAILVELCAYRVVSSSTQHGPLLHLPLLQVPKNLSIPFSRPPFRSRVARPQPPAKQNSKVLADIFWISPSPIKWANDLLTNT